jgi:hypothetical protein
MIRARPLDLYALGYEAEATRQADAAAQRKRCAHRRRAARLRIMGSVSIATACLLLTIAASVAAWRLA